MLVPVRLPAKMNERDVLGQEAIIELPKRMLGAVYYIRGALYRSQVAAGMSSGPGKHDMSKFMATIRGRRQRMPDCYCGQHYLGKTSSERPLQPCHVRYHGPHADNGDRYHV